MTVCSMQVTAWIRQANRGLLDRTFRGFGINRSGQAEQLLREGILGITKIEVSARAVVQSRCMSISVRLELRRVYHCGARRKHFSRLALSNSEA